MVRDNTTGSKSRLRLDFEKTKSESEEALCLELPEDLDFEVVEASWPHLLNFLGNIDRPNVIIHGKKIQRCDSAGISLLNQIQKRVQNLDGKVDFSTVPEEILGRLKEFHEFEADGWVRRETKKIDPITDSGHKVVHIFKDICDQIYFLGELMVQTVSTLKQPLRIPWREVVILSQKVGTEALGIVSLISFLIGMIMAFQSAIPMKQFGAELFVADLVGISLVRELGPLMTAILLAGRTGAAFAAEIGTMKVNEEIDALTTMGLKPVKFLVVSRVLAAVLMTPLLTAYADFMGLVGGGIVFCSFGFPLVTYLNELDLAVKVMDFVGGSIKSVVFGFLVASIGCLRGLQTKSGASAVGQATTSAVVSGIILIVIADGLFSVLYYYLGI